MASSVLVGQTALCALPPVPLEERSLEESISTYDLPVQLKISQNQAKKKGTAAGVLGNGMNVFKVSKVRSGLRTSNGMPCIETLLNFLTLNYQFYSVWKETKPSSSYISGQSLSSYQFQYWLVRNAEAQKERSSNCERKRCLQEN